MLLNLLNWFDKILQFFVYPKYKAAVNIRKTKIAQNFFLSVQMYKFCPIVNYTSSEQMPKSREYTV